MAYRRTTIKERKRAVYLYEERGLSSPQVAGIVGCSEQSVLRWVRMYGNQGVRSRSEGRALRSWTRKAKQKARDMGYYYLKVRTVVKVADHFGCTPKTAMRYLQSEHNPYPYPLKNNEPIRYAV